MSGRRFAELAALCGLWLLGAGSLGAEPREVGAAVQLRSGPGTQFPAAAALGAGEQVDVVESANGWARVKLGDGREGWVGVGYLSGGSDAAQPVAAPDEVTRLRAELAAATAENERLAAGVGASQSERGERERLASENAELRGRDAGTQWVVGALIFATGMTLGAILRGVGSRRAPGRLRL